MLLDTQISIKIVPSTKLYWSNKLNLNLLVGTNIYINQKDLPESSSVKVTCKCDECGEVFTKKYANKKFEFCNKCQKRNRMKGNSFGIKNIKYIKPNIDDFKNKLIEFNYNKSKLAKHFNTSIPVINKWLSDFSIILPKYSGRLYFKNKNIESELIEKINVLKNTITSKSEIARLLNIPFHILLKLEKKHNIQIKNKFLEWKDEYNKISNNLSFYINENQTKSLKVISEENNISIEQLKRVFKENNISVILHSYNKSKGELECKAFIESLGYECKSMKFNKKFELDCYVEEQSFGLEYCGEYWHSFNKSDNKSYHNNKFIYFKNINIKTMMIFESEWNNKRSIIESMIRYRLKSVDIRSIAARKCIIKKISNYEAKIFHNLNHIAGGINSSINIGLFYNNELVSVLSIMKSRYDKKYEYEISRFSTIINTNVIGGFSKAFKFFIKNYNVKSCLTYADLRFGEGKVYEQNGFNFIKQTRPNYYYYKPSIGKLESRIKFQKNKLKKMPNFDNTKTEYEIMKENGYYKIYDCGNYKYGWERN